MTLPHFSFIYHFSHISFTFVHTRNYCCAYFLERWLHCSVDFVSIYSPPLNRSLRESSVNDECILLPFDHCLVDESYQQPFLLLATDNVLTTILVSMLFQLDPQINRACNPAFFFFRESVQLAWIISTPSTLTSITTLWPSVFVEILRYPYHSQLTSSTFHLYGSSNNLYLWIMDWLIELMIAINTTVIEDWLAEFVIWLSSDSLILLFQ